MSDRANSSDALKIARHNMVEYQIRCCKILNPELLDMLESMPREDYVPDSLQSLAYMEGHVPLPCNQEMLTPLQEASIIQQLNLQGTENVLEIGTGSGYLTNLLALHAGHVTSCEIHSDLASTASANLSSHGIDNATVLTLNAMDAEAVKAAPELTTLFDAIVIGASLQHIPAHIEALLEDDSQLMAFIGHNPVVQLVHQQRMHGAVTNTTLFETLLQDIEGIPQKREFIF